MMGGWEQPSSPIIPSSHHPFLDSLLRFSPVRPIMTNQT
jgi:hypothetical protein